MKQAHNCYQAPSVGGVIGDVAQGVGELANEGTLIVSG